MSRELIQARPVACCDRPGCGTRTEHPDGHRFGQPDDITLPMLREAGWYVGMTGGDLCPACVAAGHLWGWPWAPAPETYFTHPTPPRHTYEIPAGDRQ